MQALADAESGDDNRIVFLSAADSHLSAAIDGGLQHCEMSRPSISYCGPASIGSQIQPTATLKANMVAG
jgi:hypothetical protein